MKFDYSEMTEEQFLKNKNWLWWKVQRFDELPFKPWDRDKTEKNYLQRITNESFWVLPKPKKIIPVDDYGSFEISTHVFLNESLQLLVNDHEKINNEIDDLTFKSLKKLKIESKELQGKIESINNDVSTYLESCKDYFIDSLSESDIDTLSDSVQEAQTAFYGAAFGNLFAIRKLIPKYNIRSQWIENKISTLAGLLHQIAISHYPKQSEKKWQFLFRIFDKIKEKPVLNDQIIDRIFREEDKSYDFEPINGYFKNNGKANASAIAKGMKVVYENQTDGKIKSSTIRKKKDLDWEKIQER
jgi:hypothetical protein